MRPRYNACTFQTQLTTIVRLMDSTPSHTQLERANVVLRGVPVGALWLSEGDVVFASLEPTPAFDAIIDHVQRASARVWARGFLQPSRQRIAIEALAPAPGLAFELRDANGAPLHADFVNIVASPRPGEPAIVVVCRKYAHAAVASLLRPPHRSAGDERRDND